MIALLPAVVFRALRQCLVWFCAALLLVACQTATVPQQGLSEAQIAGLRKAGFVETEAGWSLNLSGSILFDIDTDRITTEAERIVAEVVHALKTIEIDSVRVEGHTDSVGTSAYNLDLSTRRAEAVAREFIAHGMLDERIVRRSFGSQRPIADNSSSEGRAQNRRVAIIVPAY